jgi:exopolysaccharide biosynthesis protein
MSKLDFDLDDILSEFRDPQPEAPAPAREEPQPEPPAREEPAYDEPTYREPAYEEPAYAEPTYAEPRRAQTAYGKRARAGAGAVVAGLGARFRSWRESLQARGARQGRLPAWLPKLFTPALLILSLLCLLWIVRNVHPASGAAQAGSRRVNLAARIAPDAQAPADPDDPDAPAPKTTRYVIEEGSVVAPAPNPACYGKISVDEPEKMMAIIQQARDYGLLREDETVAFDPTVEFYKGADREDIEYYLDETILVICWKEVVDGYTCSFAEVKVADPSQFRRKLADDTFASANQYYSSTLHKSTNAVLSLNADFYQNRDFGVVVYDRKLFRFPTGTYTGSYKKYNCLETCYVNGEGDFIFTELGQVFTQEELEQFIADNDILFSISFGPVLVRDGEPLQCSWYPVGEIEKPYSRAGIGQVDRLHYLYMSVNHSPEMAARWTVNQFAQYFAQKPVKNAYCLDGGQTGEIVFQGRAYNHVDFGEERPVSDNIYFASAIGGTEVHG